MKDTAQPIRDDIRFRILRLIEANPIYSQRQIADVLCISLGSVNGHLRCLMNEGLIVTHRTRLPRNVMSYSYTITPLGTAEKSRLAGAFLSRRQREYESLRQEIAAVEREIGD